MMSKAHEIAHKVHALTEIHNLRDIVHKFAGIVTAYARLCERECQENKYMLWRQREMLHTDPLIRVCLDHMVRVAGGQTMFNPAPGYGVLYAMVEEGMQEVCHVRHTHLKDTRPDKLQNNQPGNDIYRDTPYDGGEVQTDERAWLFLNCDINDLEHPQDD